MQVPVACEILAWRSFGQLSGAQPSAWIWAWSWDPLKLMRRNPPHHLSPAWAKHPAGLDPEAGLGRSKSPQQRSVQAGKPVNSEQVSCSFSSNALTPNACERHLRHVLLSYMKYHNEIRTHLSLEKDAPVSRAVKL